RDRASGVRARLPRRPAPPSVRARVLERASQRHPAALARVGRRRRDERHPDAVGGHPHVLPGLLAYLPDATRSDLVRQERLGRQAGARVLHVLLLAAGYAHMPPRLGPREGPHRVLDGIGARPRLLPLYRVGSRGGGTPGCQPPAPWLFLTRGMNEKTVRGVDYNHKSVNFTT